MTARVIAALDTADLAQAQAWAEAVHPHCGMVKLGLEFFMANGASGVNALGDIPVMLDLKFHDIPHTVAGAVRAVLPLRPRMLTLHASGGATMIAAAREAAGGGADDAGRPLLLAVTVLTSLDAAALKASGVEHDLRNQVMRLARLSLEAGADGLVCSAQEAAALRVAFGPAVTLVVPGIRPTAFATDDQKRTMTPRQAAGAGADWLVIGRPITSASDPGAAARAIAAELAV